VASFVGILINLPQFRDAHLCFDSDQPVTLTTVKPHLPVRIVGITSDHGLLRTLPERGRWSQGGPQYVDLQPDGNSFDLMSGLIRTKT
jgi:biotin---protein ligase